MGEHRSGEIEDACAALPKSSRQAARRALPEVRALMEQRHEGALSELEASLA